MSPKKLIFFCLFLVCCAGFSQSVAVEDDLYSPSELVNVLLQTSCLEISNIGLSSNESVAYFTNQDGAFPISEGIVIRSGRAEFSEGSYTDLNLSSQLNNETDPFLEQLNIDSGQSPFITDVAYLQFDFVPLSSNFSFDFLFASNEYGEWQCISSDVFAFLLTDLSSGETTNLAIIPGTEEPVSVRSIKDNAYNGNCSSDNPELFSTYNVDDPEASTINMRGRTVVLNASSEVIVGNSYQIRLVIGDSQDALYDSAIFLAAGSFSTSLDLGVDRTICAGDDQILQTNLDPDIYLHTWTKDGNVIPGETGNTLIVTEPGIYAVSIVRENTSCSFGDEIIFSELMVGTPPDLALCDTPEEFEVFDLTSIDPTDLELDAAVYDLVFYATLEDMEAGNPIPTTDLNAYESSGGESVYIKIRNLQTGNTCDTFYTTNLLITSAPNANVPDELYVCDDENPITNLNYVIPQILGNQNPNDFNFYFFLSEEDAEVPMDAIENPMGFPVETSPTTIWVRMEDVQNPDCYSIVSFEISVHEKPVVDTHSNVEECSMYELPPLENGSYFTESNGSGIQLFPGDIIEELGTYYIFSGPTEFGCTNQTSFQVFLAEDYEISGPFCGHFNIPLPPVGSFYTAPGGPLGGGVLLPPGTTLSNDQTIYYYAEVEGVFCCDTPFDIEIIGLPPIDDPEDVISCGPYVLPPLTHGAYYTESAGSGIPLSPGDEITESKDVYIYITDSVCWNQSTFYITVIPEFTDIDACGSYELPDLEVGGFFTEALGGGEQIPEGTILTSSQTLFFYYESDGPNCTDNLSFHIEISQTEVDELQDVLLCEGEFYELPPLENGNYFTETEGGGDPLSAGDFIESSQMVYIYNSSENCAVETSFFVEIRPHPEIDHFTDIHICGPYELPVLENGNYYTETGGNGEQLPAGTVITSDQTIYIYNTYDDFPSCYAEDAFSIYFDGIDVGNFENVSACDEYILPALSVGNYFTEAEGQGTMLSAGEAITSDQELFVYAENGERFVCTSEASFLVDISTTPQLGFFPNIESCGSYTLPDLPQDSYNVGYFWEPNGQNEITDYSFSEAGTYTIYVYATSFDNINCFDETQFTLTIYPLLNLEIEDSFLCSNLQTGEIEIPAFLDSGLDPSEFTVNWYFQGNLIFTGPTLETYVPGTYTVETIKLDSEIGAECNYAPTTVEVQELASAVASVEVSEAFAEIAVITVHIHDGIGAYEFQLDDGDFQYDNEFYDVQPGFHTITIRGVYGNCGETVLEVEVIKYPKFFTPNSDGHNDTWNIRDLENHPEAIIYIFDRFGKLLTSLSPNAEGWNGLYNGRRMPSDDYWFRVEFVQDGVQRIFRSHFSLVR